MSLEDTLKHLLEVNLFENPKEMVVFTDEPKIPGYICLPQKEPSAAYDFGGIYGQGYNFNQKLAKIKSVAEFLERLSIKNPKEEILVNSNNSSYEVVDPTLFFHFSDGQIDNKNKILEIVKKDSYKCWPSYNYLEKKEIAIPAQLIFLSDKFSNEISIIPEQITTGTALGKKSTSDTFNRGLMEVIERDAFMISYLKKRKVNEIVGFNGKTQEFLEYLDRYKLETHIFDITSDIDTATFMTITLDRTGIGPAVTVGLRSGYNHEQTITESVLESIQSRSTSRLLSEMEGESKILTESEVTSMEARCSYWAPAEKISYLDFWLEYSPKIKFDDLPKYASSPEETLKKLETMNYHIFLSEVTLPEIGDAGFEVSKVIVPELHPLYLDERAKCLYSRHAGSIKEDKSLKPHPFT